MIYPQGYHITWGTYGMRLTGGDKPFVDRQHNEYGSPLPAPDAIIEQWMRDRMVGEPVLLTREQREVTEAALMEVSRRYEWTVHTLAAQSDHVHVVITAVRDGEALRDALKACASRELNKLFGKRTWWAEKGSAKYLWEKDYFENAVKYVRRQRDW